jgi:hypothetical protein
MKEKLWQLFKITGDIRYYIMYKEMENTDIDGKSKSEGNSNR